MARVTPGARRRLGAALQSVAAGCALAGVSLAGCTPAQAPAVRRAGKIMALGGVAGIVGAALATRASAQAGELLIGFEVMSALGIATYAYAELTWPPVEYRQETLPERNHRWAKILTERASGAAREGRCARVRRLELRIQHYDREIHDFVLLKDPEVVKCLEAPAGADPAAKPAVELPTPPVPEAPAPTAEPPAGGPAPQPL